MCSKSSDDVVTSISGNVIVWFSAISKPQQHDWSLGRRSSIISRTVESVSICTLGVTGAILGGALGGELVTTVGFINTVVAILGSTSNGGFVPTTTKHTMY